MGQYDKTTNDPKVSSVLSKGSRSIAFNKLRTRAQFGLSGTENILIHRRRINQTVAEAAESLDLSKSTYKRYFNQGRLPTYNLGYVSFLEICFLARHYLGLTQKQCAKELGISRFWFVKMEIGIKNPTKLYEFWGFVDGG